MLMPENKEGKEKKKREEKGRGKGDKRKRKKKGENGIQGQGRTEDVTKVNWHLGVI